jgi:hypothetical protein
LALTPSSNLLSSDNLCDDCTPEQRFVAIHLRVFFLTIKNDEASPSQVESSLRIFAYAVQSRSGQLLQSCLVVGLNCLDKVVSFFAKTI